MRNLLLTTLMLSTCFTTINKVEAEQNQPILVNKSVKKRSTILAKLFKKYPKLKKEYLSLLPEWKTLSKKERKKARTKWFQQHPKFYKEYMNFLRKKYKVKK